MGNKVVNQLGETIGTVVEDAEKNPTAVSTDINKAVNFFEHNGLNTRTIEKLVVYGAGLVAATNGFAQLNMPANVRGVLMAAAAVIVGSLHVSGNAGKV